MPTPRKEYVSRRGNYLVRCVLLTEDHEPEQWYWHLFRDEVRINGGINDSVEEAMWAAGLNYRRDNGEWAALKNSERV